jgi:autotransporter-associated beta strand protein
MNLGSATRTISVENTLDTISGVISGAAGAGLTKSGAGTLTLSGTNTYSGDTTVNVGTLEGTVATSVKGNVSVLNGAILKLSNASAIDTTASLTLEATPSAGTVNLNFTGTQTISALNFSTTSKAQGTWGAIGSGATHQNAAFTGSGLLNVTSGGGGPTTSLDAIAAVCDGTASSLTAHVAGGSLPSGSVEFFDGVVSLGTAPLVSGAAIKSLVLAVGPHSLTAMYLGDGNNNQSTSASQAATVNPLPIVTVNSATICAGGSATLTATTGASSPSYLWSPGGATTASVTVSPASTTTYTVTVTDGTTGCANGGSGTVTIISLPMLATDTTNQTACAGSEVMWSVVATGSGLSYQWQRDGTNLLEGVENFSGTTTATLTNSAVASQDGVDAAHGYACLISSGTCSTVSTLASLMVNPLPTVSVNSETICAGGSATLTATTGASSPTCSWSPGGAATASITVSPSSTTTYTVTVTDGATGCANSGSGIVTVTPLPVVSVNSTAICAGSSATLTATTGASSASYLWSPGGATTASISVSPSSTTTYTVTVTDGTTGCTNSGSGTVTVNLAPTANAGLDQTVCAGGPVSIGGSPTASGGMGPYTYSWTPTTGLSDAAAANPTATITRATTYTVTVTDANGCGTSDSVSLTIVPEPVIQSITISGTDVTLVWTSLAGRAYRVQYTADLTPTVIWTDLTPDVTAAASTATYTDLGVPSTQRFYRVSIVCP